MKKLNELGGDVRYWIESVIWYAGCGVGAMAAGLGALMTGAVFITWIFQAIGFKEEEIEQWFDEHRKLGPAVILASFLGVFGWLSWTVLNNPSEIESRAADRKRSLLMKKGRAA